MRDPMRQRRRGQEGKSQISSLEITTLSKYRREPVSYRVGNKGESRRIDYKQRTCM